MSPSSGIPPRSHLYLLLESLFTIPRASEMKAGTKSSLLPSSPPWKVYWYKYLRLNQNYKNRNAALPPSASHVFPCLGPNQSISALSCNSSANADHNHTVLSHFIVSSTRHLCSSEPTCSSPDLVLDAIGARCKPAPHCSCCRPRLCFR